VFQKLWVDDNDPRESDPVKAGRKKDRAKKMLLAIDFNAGRGLSRLAGKPTDDDLMANLCNKPMVIRVGVWAMTGSQGDDMNGNWVQAVAASTKPVNITTTPLPKPRASGSGSSASSSAATSGFASDLGSGADWDVPF
jgi:hypothetical protein